MTPEQRLAEALAELRRTVWATVEPPLTRLVGWLNRLLAPPR